MIDCGVPFSKMKKDLYMVDTLLLTHTHSDHINVKTLGEIKKKFPRVKIYGNWDVGYSYGDYLTKIIGTAPIELSRKRIIYPYDGEHDVPVTYFFIDYAGTKIFYATDTTIIENPYKWKFDYIFCESNYDKVKLNQMRESLPSGKYDPANASFRHLSTQRCKEFYYVNRKDNETPLIELHKSKRFY